MDGTNNLYQYFMPIFHIYHQICTGVVDVDAFLSYS